MKQLTIEKKVKKIKEICDLHHITAYEIGENTKLNTSGVHKILNGSIKKPRHTTLDIILEYLEEKIVGSALPGHQNYSKEASAPYGKQSNLTNLIKTLERKIDALMEGQDIIAKGIEETIVTADGITKLSERIDKNTTGLKTGLQNLTLTINNRKG